MMATMRMSWPNTAQCRRAAVGLASRCALLFVLWCETLSTVLAEEPTKAPTSAHPTAAGIAFFESRIRPVLTTHCYACHSSQIKSPQGGLRLDSRDAMRQGGEQGHAVVPGDEQASLILNALRYESLEMPPDGPLDPGIIEDFATWIQMGAPDPRDRAESAPPAAIDLAKGRQHWAFQPRHVMAAPASSDPRDVSAIDRFLADARRREKLEPVDAADRATLLRRVTFDLIGLQPTPAEITAFLADESPGAYERVVDRLLKSTQFGERWGRHWLDVARYAESMGRTRNVLFRDAWRYRDYVIDSFNEDKPYDQFVREQLAGDLLPAHSTTQRANQLIATGFLALGSHDLNERNPEIYRMEVVGEQIDLVSRAFLAMTVGCARCHDHKFDPIPTHDYYALAGIFRSTELLNGYTNRRRADRDYDEPTALHSLALDQLKYAVDHPQERFARGPTEEMDTQKAKQVLEEFQAARRELRSMREEMQRRFEATTGDARRANPRRDLREFRQRQQQTQQRVRMLGEQLAAIRQDIKTVDESANSESTALGGPHAMGVCDRRAVRDAMLLEGGDVNQPGARVPRGYLQVISLNDSPQVPTNASGRRELAEWLTRPDHPLTARVIVNRVWHHLFGQGIVTTVDNFGITGDQPSHPELLDYLADRFIRDGWSTKKLIRSLVLTRTYQLSSHDREQAAAIDGDNRYLWRMPSRRLEAEAIRDAILSASGTLRIERPQGSIVATLPANVRPRQPMQQEFLQRFAYRSVYLPIVRDRLPEALSVFDFPDPTGVQGDRDVTTVATQALWMMNNPLVARISQQTAEYLVDQYKDPRTRIEQAYLLTVSRLPTPEQTERLLAFVDVDSKGEAAARSAKQLQAWADVVQSLIASAEFRYR